MQPFEPPIYLGILQVNLPATQFEISLTKTLHDKSVCTFQSYWLIQRALVQQVLEAIGEKYLSFLRNWFTGQVPSNTRDLILHLFRVYSKIIPQQLKSKYDAVESLNYSIDEPIDVIFGRWRPPGNRLIGRQTIFPPKNCWPWVPHHFKTMNLSIWYSKVDEAPPPSINVAEIQAWFHHRPPRATRYQHHCRWTWLLKRKRNYRTDCWPAQSWSTL